MNKLFLIAIAILLGLGLLIDNSLIRPSSRQVASVNTHDSAPPVENNFDLSELSPTEFARAFKYQLMTSSRIVQDNDNSGLRLGNFYVRGNDNQRNFVCSKFTSLELVFEAEGVAISGSIPQMTVTGPCLTGSDSNFIEALPIPYSRILSSPVMQKDFEADVADSNSKIAIHFRDVVEQWPEQWNLVGVKLFSPDAPEALSLNGYEVISILGTPLTLNWHH